MTIINHIPTLNIIFPNIIRVGIFDSLGCEKTKGFNSNFIGNQYLF